MQYRESALGENSQLAAYPPVKDEDTTHGSDFLLYNRLSPRQILVNNTLLVVVTIKRTRLRLVRKTMAIKRKSGVLSASDVANGLLSIRAEDEICPSIFGTLNGVGNDLERLLRLVQSLPLQELKLHLLVEAGHYMSLNNTWV